MGKGTIAYKGMPKNNKIYGDGKFFIRPFYDYAEDNQTRISGTLYIRPVTDEKLQKEGYKFCIEGEFDFGVEALKEEKKEVIGMKIKYDYYEEDLIHFTDKEFKRVKKFCENKPVKKKSHSPS